MKFVIPGLLAVLLAACAPLSLTGGLPGAAPDPYRGSLAVSPHPGSTIDTSNWKVTRTQLAPGVYEFSLASALWSAGGDGEGRLVLRRAIESTLTQIHAEKYEIITSEEGVNSAPLFSNRFISAKVKFQ